MSQFFTTKRSRATFVTCPVCNKQVPSLSIDIHLDTVCLKSSAKLPTDAGSFRLHDERKGITAASSSPAADDLGNHAHVATQNIGDQSNPVEPDIPCIVPAAQELPPSKRQHYASSEALANISTKSGNGFANGLKHANSSVDCVATENIVTTQEIKHHGCNAWQQESGQKRKWNEVDIPGPAEERRAGMVQRADRCQYQCTETTTAKIFTSGATLESSQLGRTKVTAGNHTDVTKLMGFPHHDSDVAQETHTSESHSQISSNHKLHRGNDRVPHSQTAQDIACVSARSDTQHQPQPDVHSGDTGCTTTYIAESSTCHRRQSNYTDEPTRNQVPLGKSSDFSTQAEGAPHCVPTNPTRDAHHVTNMHRSIQQSDPVSLSNPNSADIQTQAQHEPVPSIQPSGTDRQDNDKQRTGGDDMTREQTNSTAVLLAEGSLVSSVCVPRLAAEPPHDLQVVPHSELHGQILLANFLRPEEERLIVEIADSPHPPWRESTFNGSWRGKAWGAVPDLFAGTISNAKVPMPPLLLDVANRMRQVLQLLTSFHPNECNAIDYHRGKHVLTPHVDNRKLSTEFICNLCLVGRVIMTFSRQKGPPHQVRILLPPRCVQVLSKDSRYSYTHAIAKEDVLDPRRISITFRQSPITKPQLDTKRDIRNFIGKQKPSHP